MSAMALDEIEQHRADLARADAKGMTLREFRSWRSRLRRDYRSLESPGKVAATILAKGALFFLFDGDAHVSVAVCNRPMTDAEWVEYSAHPACNRRRKPGETIEDDEERARRRRVVGLMQGILEDKR